jgi:arylformamidase
VQTCSATRVDVTTGHTERGRVSAARYGADMRLVDLSHVIRDGMVTYPGLPGPEIGEHLSWEASHARYAPGTEIRIGSISMVANTGTYLDTPAHRYRDGWGITDLPLEMVAAVPALVIDAAGPAIGPEAFEQSAISQRAVLFRTGWSRHFGTDRYGEQGHPYLTAAAADALAAAHPTLVGIDSVNIDGTETGERPVHSALLAAGIPIIEHLTNLEELPADGFEFFAVPQKVEGMGTFPVRAFALLR